MHEFRFTGEIAVVVNWSVGVFMAACIGYWLLDDRGEGLFLETWTRLRPVVAAIASRSPAATDPAVSTSEKTDSTRDDRASKLVDRLSLWSAAAGLIPVPLIDIAAVWGVQFHMLRSFLKFTEFGVIQSLPAWLER